MIHPLTARLIHQFNADEEHWRRTAGLRTMLRYLFYELSEEELDEMERKVFERTRPPEDCVGLPG